MPRLPIVLLLAMTSTALAEEGEHEEHHEHGPWELRTSIEAPLYRHASEGSTNIGKEFEPELDVMISYVIEEKRLSLDLELGEALLLSTSEEAIDTPKRVGTVVRPGVAYSPAEGVPLYFAALLAIHLEPSPVTLGFRLGVGTDLHLGFAKLFFEADFDVSAAGTGNDAFKHQDLVLATGLLFHL